MKSIHTYCLSLLLGLSCLTLNSCDNTPAPAAIGPLPTPEQIQWHKTEMYAFVHFGLNTFNNLEWGYGDTPAATFNPEDLNCEQWVKIFKEIGMKGVILTAKHHDGFCLWQTETTDYSVKNSPWKDGKGDVVKDLSEACKKHGLKFGIYLSPWDRNNAHYAQPEYVQTYHNQIRELTSNYGPLFEFWFDGANGGNGWYGGANETRSIDPIAYYDYPKARDIIHEKHPDAILFGGPCQSARWVGNEQGWAGDTHWSIFGTEPEFKFHYTQSQWGTEKGPQWVGSETDVSVRPGWFYHAREDHQLKSISQLLNIYYRSVGHNSNLILNFPVALSGRIHPADSARIMEWARILKSDFENNLLTKPGVTITADNERSSSKFAAKNVLNGNWDSYWATADDVVAASLTVNFPEKQAFNRVVLQEYIPLGQRVRKFDIEAKVDGEWIPAVSLDTLSTIGYKRIVRLQTVEAEGFRVNIRDARGALCINTLEAYLAAPVLEEPQIFRNAQDVVNIAATDKNLKIYYTTDGTEPNFQSTEYTEPFTLAQKATVKAIGYDPIQQVSSPMATAILDIPASAYTITEPKDENAIRVLDGNPYSFIRLPKDKAALEITLDNEYTIAGFKYTPNQNRSVTDYITHYALYIDNKKVAEGEFSNIQNNPVLQEVRLPQTIKGKKVRFVPTGLIPNATEAGIGEISIITE